MHQLRPRALRAIAFTLALSSTWTLTGCRQHASSDAKDSAPSPIATSVAEQRGYRIFVTNEMSGDLTVIDAQTREVVATVPLGKRPRGLYASADGRTLFVALSGSPVGGPGVDESTLPPADKQADGIGVIDVPSLKVTRILRGFSDPERVAVSSDGKLMYVASEDTGTAVIADTTAGGVVATLPVGHEPEGVVLNHAGTFAYVTSEADSQVSVVDTTMNKVVKQFAAGKRPRDVGFSPDDAWAWISGEADGSLSLVDARKHTVIDTIHVPGKDAKPMGVVVSRDGKYVYVTTGRGRTVVKFDAMSHGELGSARVGARPWGIALSPDDTVLYTANGPSDDVSIVDALTMNVVGSIPVGKRPWGVAILPALTP